MIDRIHTFNKKHYVQNLHEHDKKISIEELCGIKNRKTFYFLIFQRSPLQCSCYIFTWLNILFDQCNSFNLLSYKLYKLYKKLD